LGLLFYWEKVGKNQLALLSDAIFEHLHARIAQLEATVGGQAASDSTPTPSPPSENPQ